MGLHAIILHNLGIEHCRNVSFFWFVSMLSYCAYRERESIVNHGGLKIWTIHQVKWGPARCITASKKQRLRTLQWMGHKQLHNLRSTKSWSNIIWICVSATQRGLLVKLPVGYTLTLRHFVKLRAQHIVSCVQLKYAKIKWKPATMMCRLFCYRLMLVLLTFKKTAGAEPGKIIQYWKNYE